MVLIINSFRTLMENMHLNKKQYAYLPGTFKTEQIIY